MNIVGWFAAGGAGLVVAILAIPKDLVRRWRPLIVDHLDKALRRKVSRFNRRYREFVLASLRFIDLKGLATVGFFTPELDAVFVDVSLAYAAPHDIPEGLLAHISPTVTDRHSINDFLNLPEPAVLAVIGVPGSGKTTLLRHTARLICQARRRFPILLYLRDHVAAIVRDDSLPALVRGTLGRHAPTEPPQWFEKRLQAGDCVVLLDGLDEVANAEDRKKVAAWVERQTKQYPRNRFVITSRPQGFRTAPIEGAIVLQVRGFTDDQVTRFIHGWYLAAEQHSTGATGEEVTLRAEEAANDLVARLDAAPNLYELTVNPLLLTMIANVHRYRSALPGSRADLYGEICQVMLWRRQEAKRLDSALSGDKKEKLLRAIAFTMMQQRVRDRSRTDILAELSTAMRRFPSSISAEEFLADVSSNGLLIERESGMYSFAHLTFQEYLAAVHIQDKGQVHILSDSVDDPWWSETTLLYTARSDADPIVRACLDSGSVTALSLAFDILGQRSELSRELGERLVNLLGTVTRDPAHQSLRRRLLVSLNLREVIRTEVGSRICARPVSWQVYRLYVEDTGAPEPDGTCTAPTDPVTGVLGNQAFRFVYWLNRLNIGDPWYRLPVREELTDPAVARVLARAHLNPWIERKDGDALWIPDGSPNPHEVTAAVVRNRLTADSQLAKPTLYRILCISENFLQRSGVGPGPEPYTTIDHVLGVDIAFRQSLLFIDGWRGSQSKEVHDTHDPHSLGPAIMGNGLWIAAMKTRRRALLPPFEERLDWLASEIQDILMLQESVEVALDTLVALISASRQWLKSNLLTSSAWHWANEVAMRLESVATPVLAGKQPLTSEIAAAIRIGAVCLAIEADLVAKAPHDDGHFKEIAAGITLLEQRRNGEVPVTETIMLAIA